MSRNKLDRIKAAQLEAARKTGYNPYDTSARAELFPRTQPGAELAAPEKTVSTVGDQIAPARTAIGTLADYQLALVTDTARLASLRDIEEKIRFKKIVLPTYIDFVNDYVKQGDNYPNAIAVQVMIWLLDVGDIEQGLSLSLHLVKQGQRMPAKFDRDMPTFLCDFFYDWANATLKEDQNASPYLDVLIATAENDKWDVHPLCLSKLFAMLAKHKMRTEDYQAVIALCEKAEKANPEGAGVKKLKASAQAKLNKQVK